MDRGRTQYTIASLRTELDEQEGQGGVFCKDDALDEYCRHRDTLKACVQLDASETSIKPMFCRPEGPQVAKPVCEGAQ